MRLSNVVFVHQIFSSGSVGRRQLWVSCCCLPDISNLPSSCLFSVPLDLLRVCKTN